MNYSVNGIWTITLTLVANKEIKFLAGNDWGAFDYEDNSGGANTLGTPRPIQWTGGGNFITPANTVADLKTSKYGTIVSFDIGCDNASSYDVQIGIILKYSGFYGLRLPDWAELKVCRNVVNPYPAASLLFRYDLTDLNNDVYNTIPSSARRDFPNGFNELLINLKAAYAFHVQ